jgi:hypothetical protein
MQAIAAEDIIRRLSARFSEMLSAPPLDDDADKRKRDEHHLGQQLEHALWRHSVENNAEHPCDGD